MSVDETRVLPHPQLESVMVPYAEQLRKLISPTIDTSKYDPKIADRTQLQKDAMTAAGGLGSLVGTGLDASGGVGAPTAGSIASFMSPYQQQVMDTTLAEYDRQQTIGQTGLRDAAIQAGAYGGGREGVQQAQYMNQGALGRAQLQAQLLNQGFQQAQTARAADMTARQGLGTYMDQMGQAQQAYDQAVGDANIMAQREAVYEPFTRLGLVGQQMAAINPGAFGSTTVGYQSSQAPATPMASFLGGAAGAGGILGKLGIFG